MSNELKIEGLHNIGIQNVEKGASVEVTQILAKSYEYNDLLDKINTKKELFDLTPEENLEKRLKLSAEINQLKETFEQFKRDVIALSETFNKIEINTDRLRRAKEFFDKGEIGEARAVLEIELEQMQNEQAHLLREKEHYEKDVLPLLINNSEEFYLLAMATQTNFSNPNRFVETCKYFEDSIKSLTKKENILGYAKFLQIHFALEKAELYYNEFLERFSLDILPEEKAIVLNNLGVLYGNKGEYDKALKNYSESMLQFDFFAKSTQNLLHIKASVFRNLAILHRDYPKDLNHWKKSHSGKKAVKLFEKAIDIYKILAKKKSIDYLPSLASTLNSYAKLQRKTGNRLKALELCEESFVIRQKLAEEKPKVFLKDVASSLKRLADLHSEIEQYKHLAFEEYKKAIEIREQLTNDNPQVYSHHLASTFCGLAQLFEGEGEYLTAAEQYRNALKFYSLIVKGALNVFSPIIYKINAKLNVIENHLKSTPVELILLNVGQNFEDYDQSTAEPI